MIFTRKATCEFSKYPFSCTCRQTDAIHSEEFGLSNYMAYEVAEIVGICKRRGFVLPTVYQGPYNLIFRVSEAEYVQPACDFAPDRH